MEGEAPAVSVQAALNPSLRPPQRLPAPMERCIHELTRHFRLFTSMSAAWPPSEQLEHARDVTARQVFGALQPLSDSTLKARGRDGRREGLQ